MIKIKLLLKKAGRNSTQGGKDERVAKTVRGGEVERAGDTH